MTRPTIVFVAMEHIVRPIVAAPGEYVLLSINDPACPLKVVDAAGTEVLRRSEMPVGPAISQILLHACDDTIRWLSPADAEVLLALVLDRYRQLHTPAQDRALLPGARARAVGQG